MTRSDPGNQARHLVARSHRGYASEPTVEALRTASKRRWRACGTGASRQRPGIGGSERAAVGDEYRDALTSSIVSDGRKSWAAGRVSPSPDRLRGSATQTASGLTGADLEEVIAPGESPTRFVAAETQEPRRRRLRVVYRAFRS